MSRSEGNNTGFSLFNAKANQKIHRELTQQHEKDRHYISDLEMFVMENGLQVPDEIKKKREHHSAFVNEKEGVMKDGSLESLAKTFEQFKPHAMNYEIKVQYRNLTFWNNMPKHSIPTVGSSFKGLLMGPGKKERVDIIKDLSGRILPGRMTLVMGPPGCGKFHFALKPCQLCPHLLLPSDRYIGKTTFLKALAGQLTIGSAKLEGEILYNGDSIDCGKYLVGKVATYADEKDQHAPVLTVRETMDFAWLSTSGGHHSYNIAKDEQSAQMLNKADEGFVKVIFFSSLSSK